MEDRSPPQPLQPVLRRALHLARAGYLVFPCRRGDKRPATNNGLLDATTDEATIRTWFNNDRGLNLAVACGPQPNGINLLAIDVDPGKGGDQAWMALQNGHSVPPSPIHTTRSGGWHLFFNAPAELHNTSGRLGAGIDTRGVGGYVVVPPSKVVDSATGEVGYYTTAKEQALSVAPVPVLPDWLVEMLVDQSAGSISRHPSQSGLLDLGDSVADKAREGWDWPTELDADGWSLARRRGDQEFWTRPDKSTRDGHSAVLHLPDGPFVVWSTERPAGGRTNPDGSSSFSPWDYIRSYRAGGDARRAAALVRGQPTVATEAGGRPIATDNDTPGDDDVPWPVVPVEYWTASERNRHIFQAAQARRVSPDALDLVIFAYQALLIPPCYVLPPLIGRHQPLNFLACLVGGSGEFKSAALGLAEDLIGPLPSFVEVLELGTGEGIDATYLGPEMAVNSKGDNKPTGRLVRNNILGALFTADEGSGLTAISNRAGATIIPTMCTAWTGGRLGKANADPLKRRHVAAMSYRMAGVVNIQPSLFYELFSKQNTGGGFTGRFMFSGTTDQARPRDVPDWPGELPMFRPPNITGGPVEIELDPAIVAEIDAEAYAKHGRSSLLTSDSRTAQNLPVATRMATIAAMVEDRRRVTIDDWEYAKMRVRSSAACLGVLAEGARSDTAKENHNRWLTKAEGEIVVDDAKEARRIAKIAENIRDYARRTGGAGRGKTLNRSRHSTERHLDEQAIALAVRNGWVADTGTRLEPLA